MPLILKDPPASLDVSSNPDGKGEALELLNSLQITDVNQMPALNFGTQTCIVGDVPETYQWAINTLDKMNLSSQMFSVKKVEEFESANTTK